MGRIYFHEGDREFIFASEAKALLRVRPRLRAIDTGSVAQYLPCDCVLDNKTLFKDISLLPNGSGWVLDKSGLQEKRRYFDFSEWEQQPLLEPRQVYERFNELASTVFPKYAQSSQKVAMSLTAGLDTRAIMVSLEASHRALPCYTFGGPWGETFDIQTARKVAHLLNQQHDVIRINGEFFHEFPTLARRTIYISDGTHDAFGAHDLYFNQVAREIAPIRLTGKFGSEVVRVRKMVPWMRFPSELLQPDLRTTLDEVRSLEEVTQAQNPLSRAVCEEIPWYEFGRVAIEQSQVGLRTPYMDNDLVKLMFEAPFDLRANGGLQARYVKERSRALNAILTNLSRSGDGHWLVKEFVYLAFWSLFKAEYIYLYATPHWLTRLDRSLERFNLERICAGRQKFEAYRIWIRTKLSDFVRETLLGPAPQCTEIFDKRWMTKVVTRHLAGTHNYLREINKMLSIELIYTSLLKQEIC